MSKKEMYEIELNQDKEESSFLFSNKISWIIEIVPGKIIFNKEKFEDYGVDKFVTEFIDILENQFNIKFIKKKI